MTFKQLADVVAAKIMEDVSEEGYNSLKFPIFG